MRLELLLLADYANISVGEKLNVMGIFRNVNTSEVPARHPEMYIIVGMDASAAEFGSEHTLKIDIVDDDARQKVLEWSRNFVVPTPPSGVNVKLNHLLNVRDLVFPHYGNYAVYVTVDTLTFDQSYSLTVSETPKPPVVASDDE